MPVLSSAVSALSTFYQDSLDPFDKEQVEISTIRLLAKLPTIAAYAYKKSIGQPFLYPDNSSRSSRTSSDDLRRPGHGLRGDPEMVKALDLLLILHADHEQNCSTSTVRLVGSSHANLFASMSAGINALFGPLHGGANEAVLEMLERINSADYDVDTFMAKVKNKEDGVAHGLRAPRLQELRPARGIKKTATRSSTGWAATTNSTSPCARGDRAGRRLLRRAQALPERRLLHRPDLQGDGLPDPDVHRALRPRPPPGWIAQWREMIEDPATKIGRPRQVYIGETERDYVALSDR
jgi:citrate synthase